MSALLIIAAPAAFAETLPTDTANGVTAYNGCYGPGNDGSLQVNFNSPADGFGCASGGFYAVANTLPQFSNGLVGVNLPELSTGTPSPPYQATSGILNEKIKAFKTVTCQYLAAENLSTAADGPFLTATVQTNDGLYHANVGNSAKQSGKGGAKLFNYTTQGLGKWTPPITSALKGGKDVIQAALVFSGGSDLSVNSVKLTSFFVTGGSTTASFQLDTTGNDGSFNFEP
jgi:hypothetical protein